MSQRPDMTRADWTHFGRFEEDGGVFVVTTPTPPLPWDNYLFNDRYLSVVDHLGRGWSKLHTREGYVTFLWRLTAMYERDDNRYVFLRDDETGEFWSLSSYPAPGAAEYACRHGIGFTEISSVRDGIRASLHITVPPGEDPVELWTVRVANESGRPRRVSVFTYGEVSLRGAATHGYIHFCRGDYLPEIGALYFQNNAPGLPHPRYKAFQAPGFTPDSHDASRNTFRGLYQSLATPTAVAVGQCANSIASREPLAACFHKRLELAAGASAALPLLAGIVASPEEARALIERYLKGDGPERVRAEVAAVAESRLASPRIRVSGGSDASDPSDGARNVERLINVWAKQQMALGAGWGRWGWRGYRDLIQQTQGACYFDLPRVKRNLSEALTWQMRDGFCVRGWAPFSPKRYADSALWLGYTVGDYVKESGDTDYVQRILPYRDGGAGPVWEHLLLGCEKAFTDVGPHGLPKIHQGDWNDSLSAVGEKGRGESVWLGHALCWSLLQLRELFESTGLAEQAETAATWHREMAARINEHAWDGQWYVRAFTDDGAPLGSASCREGRIFLNAQGWAVLGEVAPPERQASMLAAVEEHLRIPYGYLTHNPPYVTWDPAIGRLTGMPPGTGENAAVYVHANAFFYAALLKMREADRALALLETVHPCNRVNPTGNSGTPPYVLPNSYYGPGYTIRPGRIEGTWVTGSASWFLHQTVETMCGVQRTLPGLRIQPCLPSSWNDIRVERLFRGDRYDIHIRRVPGAPGVRVELDGSLLPGNLVPVVGDGGRHAVEVTVPG